MKAEKDAFAYNRGSGNVLVHPYIKVDPSSHVAWTTFPLYGSVYERVRRGEIGGGVKIRKAESLSRLQFSDRN